MTAWFRVEVHVAGGIEVRSDVTDDLAREMLGTESRYIFREPHLTDRQKVERMLATQIALAACSPGGRG